MGTHPISSMSSRVFFGRTWSLSTLQGNDRCSASSTSVVECLATHSRNLGRQQSAADQSSRSTRQWVRRSRLRDALLARSEPG